MSLLSDLTNAAAFLVSVSIDTPLECFLILAASMMMFGDCLVARRITRSKLTNLFAYEVWIGSSFGKGQ